MTETTVNDAEATRRRDKVVDELLAGHTITSPEVEAAMRKVPRHGFVPGVSLEDAYDTYMAVVTKRDEHGASMSSVSAPSVQAMMLEQARVRPGMRVLEIGSGGLNAAYLAELVGPEGAVVSVDIDPEVTERARRLLDEHGYTRVEVICADSAEPIPGLGQVDVVLVTAGAWDVPPTWTEALAPEGRLVAPLRLRGLTRSIAFVRAGDHLESESARICGFVPMQGSASHEEGVLLVTGTPEIGLRFDDGVPQNVGLLDNAVRTERLERWTGITMGHRELMDTLQMHLAVRLDGLCIMAVDPELDTGIVAPTNRSFALAAADGGTFGYLVTRPTAGEQNIEFGVHALGDDREALVAKFTAVLEEWARDHRSGPDPIVCVYPAGIPRDQIPGDRVIDKVHSRVSISWPTA